MLAEMCGRPLRDDGTGGTGLGAADVADIRQQMHTLAAPWDAAHLLAALTASRAFATPAWRESEHGSPLADEMVIATLLQRPSRSPGPCRRR